ncbi:hypothetical protein G6L13_05375 [Agrobacterium tumefaciens]|uniref:hypothetical protein n=1 Tax=Agrobacterium tumefaciens TaxID=358 RepID=UPI0015734F7C|nr:hypothetical protein [Agrobacterium tumefaciens]NTA79915.1 hypothetical protein [Agrobacterium tumefaciens]
MAFFNHPVDPVASDEILVGNPDDIQVAALSFGPKRRFRQPATEEQSARLIKLYGIVVPDNHRVRHPSLLSSAGRFFISALRLVTMV